MKHLGAACLPIHILRSVPFERLSRDWRSALYRRKTESLGASHEAEPAFGSELRAAEPVLLTCEVAVVPISLGSQRTKMRGPWMLLQKSAYKAGVRGCGRRRNKTPP